MPPCCCPAHRVRQAFHVAALAPLEQSCPIQRVSASRHLPDTVVFERSLTSCAVLNQRVIQEGVGELIEGPIRESALDKVIEVIVLKRQSVPANIGLRFDSTNPT